MWVEINEGKNIVHEIFVKLFSIGCPTSFEKQRRIKFLPGANVIDVDIVLLPRFLVQFQVKVSIKIKEKSVYESRDV